LCAFALQLVTFFGFFIYYKLFVPAAAGLAPSWHIVFLPLVIIQVAALSLGVTLWMSAATAKYRDLIHVNQFLMQLWMYATPIIYPISKVHAEWMWLVWLNPMCSVVESFRLCLLGRGAISGPHLASSLFSTLVILFSGVMIYQKTERTVADIA
jgi:lipopolysaccharide transport system permease protein